MGDLAFHVLCHVFDRPMEAVPARPPNSEPYSVPDLPNVCLRACVYQRATAEDAAHSLRVPLCRHLLSSAPSQPTLTHPASLLLLLLLLLLLPQEQGFS